MNEGLAYIYRYYKIVNQKSYIGKTVKSVPNRIRMHNNSNSNAGISAAVRKYGEDAFAWEILERCPKEDACNREIFWIAALDTYSGFGYNRTIGGDGNHGVKFSEEAKKKLSIMRSGENHPMFGKKHSEETKRKISESRSGRFSGSNNPHYGKKHTKEQKEKME